MCSALLLFRLAEVDLIVDKELASDDEDQDDTRQNVRERMVQHKPRRDLAGTAAEQHKQEARKDHEDRVELRKPRDHNRRKAAAVDQRCCERMIRAADEQQSGNAAQSAGKQHRANDDAVNIDTDIASRALALADDRDLISVLAVFKVYKCENNKYKRYKE